MRKPWLSEAALEFVGSKISKDSIVFEWGSGNSTIWLAERVLEVTSIENDIDVAKEAEEELFSKGLFNVNFKYRAADRGSCSDDVLNPLAYASSEDGYVHQTFCDYVLMIDNLKKSYDFISIDGRARLSCVYHARQWVKPGGWVMLDDSERPWYIPALSLMQDGWSNPVILPGRSGKTTHFWQKPME